MDKHASWLDYLPGIRDWIPAWEAALEEHLGVRVPLSVVVIGLFVALLVVAGGFVVRRRVADPAKAVVPEAELSLRTAFELVVDATYELMKGIMPPEAARYFLPLIGTAAFFILTANLLGLVPGFMPPTSNLNMTVAMALVIFFTTHIFGVKEHGLGYFKHFLGPIIKWYALPLMVLMVFVEIVSHIVRPVSLSIRLMANMFADHQVVGAFYQLVAWGVPISMMTLGILVCVVQALVFCLLSTIYISLAIGHGEH